jgi:hypothetical protein
LITNEQLDQRAGQDLFIRDLARALQKRGHFVIAYSSDTRQLRRLLERDSITVATRLDNLPFRPDIIHSRHHLDALTAVMGLPGVPAVHHCVGSRWSVVLPSHPRIYRYIAPSFVVARWIAGHSEVMAERIAVLNNPIDLQRFATVRQPPERPRKLLVYDHLLRPDSAVVAAIKAAAVPLELEVDLLGRGFGRVVDNPEAYLPRYDIVCAGRRSAIEALSSGCAVVVLAEGKCGEMVVLENFESLRAADFSSDAEASGACADKIRREFSRFSAATCVTLAAKIRSSADFSDYAVRLEAVYRAAIAAHVEQAEDLDAEQRAAGAYLYDLARALKEVDPNRKSDRDVPLSAASLFLDVSATLAAIQEELDKPQW